MGGRHEAATAAQAIRAFVLKAAGAAYKVNIYRRSRVRECLNRKLQVAEGRDNVSERHLAADGRVSGKCCLLVRTFQLRSRAHWKKMF